MLRCSTTLYAQNLLNDVRRAVDTKTIVSRLSLHQRNSFLQALIAQVNNDRDYILDANRHDCEVFMKQRNMGDKSARPNFALTLSWVDRLLEGVERLKDLPDPLNVSKPVVQGRSNQIDIQEVSVPLGMIGVVSRLRPRIMLDAIAMSIKSGNVVLVDDGSTVLNTTKAMMESVHTALKAADIPLSSVVHVSDVDEMHTGTSQWLKLNDYIDVAIVCGSDKLYDHIAKNTTIPLIRATGHVCSLYIDKDADFKVALDVVMNAKFQRANATNSINNLLIHSEFDKISDFLDCLVQHGVNIVGDAAVHKIFPTAGVAADEDWMGSHNGFTNFHKLCVKMITKGVDEVLTFLSSYGSHQSDGIISRNEAVTEEFLSRVDSAVVYANASTRFSSGDCFGFGADLAISTSRLHCRGPVSLQCLTTKKYVVRAVAPSGAFRTS